MVDGHGVDLGRALALEGLVDSAHVKFALALRSGVFEGNDLAVDRHGRLVDGHSVHLRSALVGGDRLYSAELAGLDLALHRAQLTVSHTNLEITHAHGHGHGVGKCLRDERNRDRDTKELGEHPDVKKNGC